MRNSRMSNFINEEENSEEEEAVKQLKQLVKDENEEFWTVADKYLHAGVANVLDELAHVDGKKLIFSTNKSGSKLLAVDYATLFIEAFKEYDKFYKEIINKKEFLKKEVFLQDPMNNDAKMNLDAFDWMLKQEYTSGENAKSEIKAYKELVEHISNLKYDFLKKSNKVAYDELKKIISSLAADVAANEKNETEIELSNQPKKENVPGIEFNNIEKNEDEEKTSEEEAPKEVKQAVADAAKAAIAVKEHPDQDILKNFDTVEAQVKKMKKIFDALKNDEDYAEKCKKAEEFMSRYKDETIPALWAITAATGLQSSVERLIESVKRARLLRLLLEAEEEQKQSSGENNTSENDTDSSQHAATENKTEEKKDTESAGTSALEKAKKIAFLVDDLLKIDNSKKFIEDYKKWTDMIKSLSDELSKNEEIKKQIDQVDIKDPYEKICYLYMMCEEQGKKNDNSDKSKTEDIDDSGNSEADTAGSKPEAETAGEADNFAGGESFVRAFINKLNEKNRRWGSLK